MDEQHTPSLRRDPILVLGMHHSGTSILTEVLHAHGVFMHANMKHHESTLFTHELDDTLLMGGGAAWSRLPILSVDEVLAKTERARAFVDARVLPGYVAAGYDGHSRWGFKDPRACVLLPLYLKLFPDAQLLHIVRDEDDVAASLAASAKEGVGRVHDVAFWKELRRQHVERVRELGARHPRYLEISYESFAVRPLGVIEEVFAYLGLPVTKAVVKHLRKRVHDRSVARASATHDARPSPADVLVTTVIDPDPRAGPAAIALFRTLRSLGGRMAAADARAIVVGEVPAATLDALAALGVEVHRVHEGSHVDAVRARVLCDDEERHAWIVSLDPEVLVTGDFGEHLRGDALVAPALDRDGRGIDSWADVFARAGAVLPASRALTKLDATTTLACLDASALFVPRRWTAALGTAWQAAIEPWHDGLRSDRMDRAVTLGLALARGGIAHRVAPLGALFPTPDAVHRSHAPEDVVPCLVRRPRSATSEIPRSPHRGAGPAIEAANALLRVCRSPLGTG